MVRTYGSRLHNRSAELQVEVQNESRVFAVAGEFRQVVSNLLINAIDALPAEGGKIRIRATSAHDWSDSLRRGLRVTIADTGCGIPPEHLAKIFEPFYTTKLEVGTGLGLWFSKNAIEKNNGKLRVRSCASGARHGTVFCMFWPDSSASTNDGVKH